MCEGFLILVWDQVKGTAVKSRFSYSYDKIKHIYNHQTTNKTTLKVCPKVLIKTRIHLFLYSFFNNLFTRVIHYNSHVLLTYLLIFLRSSNTNIIINHFSIFNLLSLSTITSRRTHLLSLPLFLLLCLYTDLQYLS